MFSYKSTAQPTSSQNSQFVAEAQDAWLHPPSYYRFPPLPGGYVYAKDYMAGMRKKRKREVRRDAVYETPWLRTQFHDIYIMNLWGMEDERVLVIEETYMNNKIEEWTSILAALEENFLLDHIILYVSQRRWDQG